MCRDQIISFNDGDTWQTIQRHLYFLGDGKTERSLPAMTADGVVVSLGRVVASNGDSALKLISAKRDRLSDQQAWQHHGASKAGCETMLPELTDKNMLYFLCDQGQVVRTADFGEHWETVVPMDIAGMQQEFEEFIRVAKEQAMKTAAIAEGESL
ncbi:hypothetical protein [Photobacterium sp. 1_MG-2023]|uniref:hypothetical protein n=1 Tax=Photobacterium sp. 1_MG-2023 TaxID=3062646 RepID=UPI0026E203A3|nr:hypothetical protein [Photobacterium sp. 1_MG-2023]MDO6708312.1 hypothetical protein [Photobacterium sp. 1_MG-2023]